jgi:hypothetical protein
MTLTQERVKQLFTYDRATGNLYWKPRRGVAAGREAGCVSMRDGYRRVGIDFTDHLVHRIVWLCETGEFPPEVLDHINMDKLDNRIENLRLATKSQNGFNRLRSKRNNSGYKGVCYDKSRGDYLAKICVNYKQINIGRFANPEDAHAAYTAAAEKLHGKFARAA